MLYCSPLYQATHICTSNCSWELLLHYCCLVYVPTVGLSVWSLFCIITCVTVVDDCMFTCVMRNSTLLVSVVNNCLPERWGTVRWRWWGQWKKMRIPLPQETCPPYLSAPGWTGICPWCGYSGQPWCRSRGPVERKKSEAILWKLGNTKL